MTSKSLQIYAILFTLFFATILQAQTTDKTAILHSILNNYYKSERAVIKGRGGQFLFLFCEKANNNEAIFESVNQLKLPTDRVAKIRAAVVKDVAAEKWESELESVLASDPNLKAKVNDCLSVEQYNEKRARQNLNNQRLLIVSKPVFFENGSKALVKVVFYRTIEHNSGSVLLMEKSGKAWVIKKFLDKWST